MSERREWKVGLFVLLGLVLIGGLLIYFSKGLSWKPTYNIILMTKNVGGIRAQAAVLLSGVRVGQVTSADLAPDGKSVRIGVAIYDRYPIHGDAVFAIDSLGLLGDQFISVRPTKNEAPPLKEGDTVECLAPFDFQEVARASLTFIQRVDETAIRLNNAIRRIDEKVLNDETLTNLTVTVQNFRKASERAEATIIGINSIFETNSTPIALAVTNLVRFSEELNKLALELNAVIVTNRGELNKAIKNVETATASVTTLLQGIEEGKGIAGALVKDQDMRQELGSVLTNASLTLSNLNTLGSNMNSRGIWSTLWKPKNTRSAHDEEKSEQPKPGYYNFPRKR